jgi:hypothetical protein
MGQFQFIDFGPEKVVFWIVQQKVIFWCGAGFFCETLSG